MLLRLAIVGALFAALAGVACGGAVQEHFDRALEHSGDGGGTKTVIGVVTNVDASSLTQLNSFTLHTDDDRTLVFKLASDADRDPQNGFVAGHLRTHSLGATKVKIFYREEGGQLLAFRLEDILS